MMLVDANLLLHAYNPRSTEHDASRAWLERVLSGVQFVRFPLVALWAFLRISTNARVFEHPLTIDEATTCVAAWLAQPQAGILEPGERHWEILGELLRDGQISGPLVMDAVVAAIAIEHGATLCTTDRDFARFPRLNWTNPLTGAS